MTGEPSITEQMQHLIQSWDEISDRRAIFLNCYMRMTQNTLQAIAAGEFNDAVWVSKLLHRFADYYFDGLSAYEADITTAPAVWRITHDAACAAETAVLQNLFLGINAHINYDLVLALVDLLQPEWRQLSPDQREGRYRDHCHVNQVIGQTIDRVQDEVVERYSPRMGGVDILLGRVDEWLAATLIRNWREEVWQAAVQLLATDDPDERQRRCRQIEAVTLKRAGVILRPFEGQE